MKACFAYDVQLFVSVVCSTISLVQHVYPCSDTRHYKRRYMCGGAAQHSKFNNTPLSVPLHRLGKWMQRTGNVGHVNSTLAA